MVGCKESITITFLLCVGLSAWLPTCCGKSNSSSHTSVLIPPTVHHGIHVASWRWEEIGVFFTITVFIIVTGLAKVAFHHARWVSDHVPESCLMIVMGVSVGGIIYLCGVRVADGGESDEYFTLPTFTPRLFFLVLLPPVILESAYSLYDRVFADNLSTVLLYAVVGTLWNTFTIGFTLWGLHRVGSMGKMTAPFGLVDAMVFAALISGVDPVAVLAIFQEVGVNKDLYYLVFGESLFNDAVTVVLYTTMVTFYDMPHIPTEQYLLATLAFFTVSLGGAVVGIIFGLLSALVTRTTVHCRVVEPLAVLGIAYLSYISAELFHFSGIISIIVCGLVQSHYALQNISPKSYTTVKYFTKMVSSTCDAIIFLFLGMELVSNKHIWHTGFVLWTLLLCLLYRFLGVIILTALANAYRIHQINLQEQFLMAYGGLRGAVAFSLAEMLESDKVEHRQMFITTTLVVILFTVFIQGSTIKPLVKLLHIRLSKEGRKTLNEELNYHIISSMMAGIEEVTGVRGDFYIQRKFEQVDENYLRKVFLNAQNENSFTRLYEKLLLADHYAHLYGPVALVEDNTADVLRQPTERGRSSIQGSPGMHTSLQARFSQPFAGVELRHRTISMPSSPSTRGSSMEGGGGVVTLRRALCDNPYQKLHKRYNPNLINDECQELNEHLERRHFKARRITQLAAMTRLSAMSDPAASPELGEEFTWPKRQIHSELEGYFPENIEGLDALLERAGQRALRKQSYTGSSTGGDSIRVAPTSPILNAASTEPPPVLRQTSQLHNISELEDDSLLPHQSPPSNKDTRESSF